MPVTRIRNHDLLSGSVASGTLGAGSITGQIAATTVQDADLVLIFDNDASALRKMTRANFTAGLSTTLSGAYDAGTFITASKGPVDIHANSNVNAATNVLKLAVSGTVSGAGSAGPQILFTIPVSGESKVGATIRANKQQTDENNSTTELNFSTSENNDTLNRILKIDNVGVAAIGQGASEVYPSSGYAFMVAASGYQNAFVLENSTGDVGIGLTNPLVPLHVYRSNTSTAPQISAQQASTGDAGYFFSIPNCSYMMGIDNSDGDKFKISYGSSSDNATLGSSTRFTIDIDGKVGVGQSSPEAQFEIQDTSLNPEDDFGDPTNYHMLVRGSSTNNDYMGIALGSSGQCGAAILHQDVGSYSKGDLVFMTKESTSNGAAPVERMRIASNGYIAIGSGSTISYPLTLEKSNAAGYAARIYNSHNGNAGGLWIAAGDTSTAGSPLPLVVQDNSRTTNQFYVRQDGNYFFRGSSISTQDSKRDVADLSESALDLVKDIRVVSYNYKEDPEDRVKRIGFIADDTTNQPAIDSRLTNGGGGFDIQTLVGTLIKAVQELSSSINTLQGGD